MGFEDFFSLVQTLIVLVLVIFLANWVLKYLNKYMSSKTRIIKIVERLAVNKNSYIGVVKICGKFYLMSFGEGKNEILKELNGEEIEDLIANADEEEFKYYLEMRKKIAKKISNFRNNGDSFNDYDSTDNMGDRT